MPIPAARADVVERSIDHFRQADPGYGAAVEAAVKELRAQRWQLPAGGAPGYPASPMTPDTTPPDAPPCGGPARSAKR